jgi:hypothetical protein
MPFTMPSATTQPSECTLFVNGHPYGISEPLFVTQNNSWYGWDGGGSSFLQAYNETIAMRRVAIAAKWFFFILAGT